MKKYLFLISISIFIFNLNAQDDNPRLVIRINYSLLNFETINNSELIDFTINDVLNERGKENLTAIRKEYPEFGQITLHKLFPFLSTRDTVSISRTGQKVTVPPFWATFHLDVPKNIDYRKFMVYLDKQTSLIDYVHPEYKIEFTSIPNDTLYYKQYALNEVLPDAHINIQEAWDIELGRPYIKVAVHDSGIDTLHPDLNVVFGGAYNGADFPENEWGSAFFEHGTPVAGIIGAKRNNTTGIAGIAGGDGSDTTGCSLIDMRIKLNEPISASYYMAAVVDAARSVGTYWDYQGNPIPSDSSDFYSHTPGFGVNIGNHSYTIRTELPTLLFPDKDLVPDNTITVQDCQICREAFLFSLQNGVINVVARGNSTNVALNGVVNPTQVEDLFPQLLPDNWIISVGASSFDGTTVRDGVNQTTEEANIGYYSLYGGNMDLIAPGSDSIVYTTRSPSLTSGNYYSTFTGTSAAAPHVAGVIALLLSHYNKDCYSQKNLSIEDVEYILEHSANDILDTGYDQLSAWGRLNAGAALKMIENETKQIVHPDSLISSVVVATDTIALNYNKALIGSGWGPISRPFPLEREKNYQVVRVEVENTYSFAEYITPATQIIDIWSRPSAANGVEYYEDTVRVIAPNPQAIDTFLVFNTFDLEPFDSIVNIDLIQNIVKTRGYYYHFIAMYNPIANDPSPDVLTIDPFTNVNYWYPLNPEFGLAKLPVSIYLIDTTLSSYYDYPCDSLNLLYDEEYSSIGISEFNQDKIKVFPNPFSKEINIQFNNSEEKLIMICDLQGKLMLKLKTYNRMESISTKNFTSGIYFVTCQQQSGSKTFKIVKP